MRNGYLVGAGILISLFSVNPASAGLILPTSQGAQLIFNFNFTGSSPAAPYSVVSVRAEYSLVDTGATGEAILLDLFAKLGGSDFIPPTLSASLAGQGPGTFTAAFDASVSGIKDDGIFSVGIWTSAAKSVELLRIYAIGGNSEGETGQLDGVAAVPEPASLTLLGIGAVSAAGWGWRRRKTVQA